MTPGPQTKMLARDNLGSQKFKFIRTSFAGHYFLMHHSKVSIFYECTDMQSLFETRIFLPDFHDQPSREVRVTGTRTRDLARTQQYFPLDH